MLVIHYEELKDNLEAGLREIQSFLNLESNSDRLKCILKARDGSYKRPTLAKKTFPFNETQVEFVVGYLKNVTTFMKQRDMKPLPLDLYMQSLRSKFTAESLGHLDLVQNCTAKT